MFSKLLFGTSSSSSSSSSSKLFLGPLEPRLAVKNRTDGQKDVEVEKVTYLDRTFYRVLIEFKIIPCRDECSLSYFGY